MASLNGHGLRLDLPTGWEGQVFRRSARPGAAARAVLHAANFPLPPQRGDFGSGAVDAMGPRHVLVVLFEQDPAAADMPLFRQPLTRLGPQDFNPNGLQRALPGQAGAQRFFSHNGRAFTLYVVLGSHALRNSLAPLVNTVLAPLAVDPLPNPVGQA
jgi:hypothetical protein